jgi:hypothetical protein
MIVFYQLLDRSLGNVIKDYPTEEAALEELRGVGQEYGVDEMRSLALLKFEDGHPTLVAMDDDLIALMGMGADSHSFDRAALAHHQTEDVAIRRVRMISTSQCRRW